jgi:hypothetical protein
VTLGRPEQAADLVGGVAENAASEVLVAAAHSGGLPRLPAHDRVDHDIGNAEDQQDRSCGVASVVQSAVADPGGLEQLFPVVVVNVGVEGFAGWCGVA